MLVFALPWFSFIGKLSSCCCLSFHWLFIKFTMGCPISSLGYDYCGTLSPNEDGESFFRASGGRGGVCFFIWQMGRGLLYMGGIPIRGFLGETPVPISCPISKARPKSAKVNLTNCHREICRIKFYQIVTSDVLTSLSQFDKMLF